MREVTLEPASRPGGVGGWGRRWSRRTFSSLAIPNYRLFFIGQGVSLVGTWMQSIAQSWLVLQLSGSGAALGWVVAVQTLPVLLFSPYGGLIADRFAKRRILLVTQSVMAVLALTLGVLTVTDQVRLWMVFLVAGALGIATSVDNPTRQSFVPEMVGAAAVANAVSLNSVMVNAARAIGPAAAGVLIVTVGVGPCFLVNAASFVAVIAALLAMRGRLLHPTAPVSHAPGQLVEGLRYVWRTPGIRIPLLMMALIGALSYEFQVVLPVLAKRSLHGNADAFGYLTAAFGVGAVVGGLVVAGRRPQGLRGVVTAAVAFGLAMLAASVAPSIVLAVIALALVGATSIAFMARGNTTLQLTSTDTMRGRVMALWAVAFLGTTPIGGPVIGYVTQLAGPRWGLATGGLAALAAAALAVRPRIRRRPSRSPPATASEPVPDVGPPERDRRSSARG